ncbi:p23 chaperone protein wos2, partial [Coemansia sp. RSA 1843]
MDIRLHPPVLWAQREDIVFLTIDLHDAKDAQIDLKEQSISFKNTTDGNEYAFHLDFFKPIKPDEGKKSATGRRVLLVLDKAEGEWWPRLTKENSKPNFLKTDFDHWKDSDDSEDESPKPHCIVAADIHCRRSVQRCLVDAWPA